MLISLPCIILYTRPQNFLKHLMKTYQNKTKMPGRNRKYLSHL